MAQHALRKQINTPIFLLLFVLLLIPFAAHAQDIIVKKNGEEIKAVIIEINKETVKYKDYDLQDGPVFVLKRTSIQKIIFHEDPALPKKTDNKTDRPPAGEEPQKPVVEEPKQATAEEAKSSEETGSEDYFLANPEPEKYRKRELPAKKEFLLGAHLSVGIGSAGPEYDPLVYDAAYHGGVDLYFKFNVRYGLKTGLYYFQSPFYNQNSIQRKYGKLSYIGIPVRFVITTGTGLVGFHGEAGFAFNFLVSSEDVYNYPISQLYPNFDVVAGLRFNITDDFEITFGGHLYAGRMVNLSLVSTNILMIGIRAGAVFNLSR